MRHGIQLLALAIVLTACRTDKSILEEEEDWDLIIEDEDGDGFDSENDCNDSDSVIYPGAEELCDGVDNDCDGEIDEDVSSTFYADADGDGFGNPDVTEEACQITEGWVTTGNDCDDSDPDTYPSASERCDGIDNDCDGEIDEDVLGSWYSDADDDGYGDPETFIENCDPPSGYVSDDSDCNDSAPSAYPGATEICDEIDNDCDGVVDEGVTTTWYADTDGDAWGVDDMTTEACTQPSGYVLVPGDCDDDSAEVNPEAIEICNGIDDDCDGDIDSDSVDNSTWFLDADGDGFGDDDSDLDSCEAPSGYVSDDNDCDDYDSAVHPDAVEICDGIDNDCDSLVDDIDPDVADASTWFIDYDSDGFGTDTLTLEACEQPSSYVADDTDCDDTDEDVNPDGTEICNEIDDDCDGDIDDDDSDVTGLSTWYDDADGDGFGDSDSSSETCDPDEGQVEDDTDCDDSDEDVHPDATEICNEIDDDCDGDIDDDDSDITGQSTWYTDADGDGFGDPDSSSESCEASSDEVADDSDCDDSDEDVNPDAEEICNEIDDNCDGDIDEGTSGLQTWYEDADEDGYGDPDGATSEDCEQPSGYADNDEDCDDTDADINPAASEDCNGYDDDCDGIADSSSVCPCDVDYYDGDTEHPYMFCTSAQAWTTAQSTCDSYGYHMLTIDDSSENSWADDTADTFSTSKWWIGLNDRSSEGTFVWEDGTSVSYTNWQSGEPNNGGSNEDCTQLNRYHPTQTWNDEPCSSGFYFICEAW